MSPKEKKREHLNNRSKYFSEYFSPIKSESPSGCSEFMNVTKGEKDGKFEYFSEYFSLNK